MESLDNVDCWICDCGFVHVKWQGRVYTLSRDIGWLSSDEYHDKYHPHHHPCIICKNDKNELDQSCHSDAITMESVDRFIAVGLYYSDEFQNVNQLLSQWILQFKRDPNYAEPLGCALAKVIDEYWHDLLMRDCARIIAIPIPKHPNEGRNQALDLARAVVNRLRNYNILLIPDLITKKEPTKAGERRDKCINKCGDDRECLAKCNVEEELRILEFNGRRYRDLVVNSCVLVIDDVRTTGATIGAVARLLKDNGASKVFAAVLARNALKNELSKCIIASHWENHDYYRRGCGDEEHD